jgi:hypothetical protein
MSKQRAKTADAERSRGRNEKPVSLAPPTFDESLDAILSVRPPNCEATKQTKQQAAKKAKK